MPHGSLLLVGVGSAAAVLRRQHVDVATGDEAAAHPDLRSMSTVIVGHRAEDLPADPAATLPPAWIDRLLPDAVVHLVFPGGILWDHDAARLIALTGAARARGWSTMTRVHPWTGLGLPVASASVTVLLRRHDGPVPAVEHDCWIPPEPWTTTAASRQVEKRRLTQVEAVPDADPVLRAGDLAGFLRAVEAGVDLPPDDPAVAVVRPGSSSLDAGPVHGTFADAFTGASDPAAGPALGAVPIERLAPDGICPPLHGDRLTDGSIPGHPILPRRLSARACAALSGAVGVPADGQADAWRGPTAMPWPLLAHLAGDADALESTRAMIASPPSDVDTFASWATAPWLDAATRAMVAEGSADAGERARRTLVATLLRAVKTVQRPLPAVARTGSGDMSVAAVPAPVSDAWRALRIAVDGFGLDGTAAVRRIDAAAVRAIIAAGRDLDLALLDACSAGGVERVQPLRFGSLCSGIEAASHAFHPWAEASWFAEIDPTCSALLAERFPGIVNHGDMTAIPGLIHGRGADGKPCAAIQAPEIICGGPPCQAFSFSGSRASIADPRGKLTLAFCDTVTAADEIRRKSGLPGVVACYENVTGILTADENAFGHLLGALAGCGGQIIAPADGWATSGWIEGEQRIVAWAVLDALHFGVPQRRRRIYVVAARRGDIETTPMRDPRWILGIDAASIAAASAVDAPMAHVAEPPAGRDPSHPDRRIDPDQAAAWCINARQSPVLRWRHAEPNGHQDHGHAVTARCAAGDWRERALTPEEVEATMGFRRGWTASAAAAGTRPMERCDAMRYEMLGNSWAVPVVRWIAKRIVRAVRPVPDAPVVHVVAAGEPSTLVVDLASEVSGRRRTAHRPSVVGAMLPGLSEHRILDDPADPRHPDGTAEPVVIHRDLTDILEHVVPHRHWLSQGAAAGIHRRMILRGGLERHPQRVVDAMLRTVVDPVTI